MSLPILIRSAGPRDADAVTALLRRSYPTLLKADYSAQTLAQALPHITTAQPNLLTSGTYFLAQDDESGEIVGAGGWTDFSPTNGVGALGEGHLRHFATDPTYVRRGVGTALLRAVLASARGFEVARLKCISTLTATAFYRANGLCGSREIEVCLVPGVYLPAVEMQIELSPLS
jgi:GNAT superfamily N-acetyltransferase